MLVPNSTSLSWLAETADGFRGKSLGLFVDKNGDLTLSAQDTLNGEPPITRVTTPKHQDRRAEVTKVTCEGNGFNKNLESKDDFDAVFWTESSVEKFLYPYYHAHRLWNRTMTDLKDIFENDPRIAAIAHRAPSASVSVPADNLELGLVEGGALTWMNMTSYLMAAANSPSNGSRVK
jgi:hypothetical protein